jgi:hypothetical protein
MMYLWVSKAMGDGILLTGEVFQQKWNVLELEGSGACTDEVESR